MTDDRTTLHVRVEPTAETRVDLRERVRALEAGEDVPDMRVLSLDSEAELARLVSEANLELLRVVARERPRSMRETAELVGRDFKEVHRNLTELAELNVLELREENGAKRPVVAFDDVAVEIPVAPEDDGDEGVSA